MFGQRDTFYTNKWQLPLDTVRKFSLLHNAKSLFGHCTFYSKNNCNHATLITKIKTTVMSHFLFQYIAGDRPESTHCYLLWFAIARWRLYRILLQAFTHNLCLCYLQLYAGEPIQKRPVKYTLRVIWHFEAAHYDEKNLLDWLDNLKITVLICHY